MLAGEQDRLEKERQFRDLEVSYKQLSFLLERLNSYNTQATLVTGFAFTAFSADALQALPYDESPIRSYLFCFFCSLAMAAAIAVVCISSYLMARSERLAMNSSVEMAVAATRLRMSIVIVLYGVSLVGLFGAACFLVFATCGGAEEHCNGVGWMVVGVFCMFATVCRLHLLDWQELRPLRRGLSERRHRVPRRAFSGRTGGGIKLEQQ